MNMKIKIPLSPMLKRDAHVLLCVGQRVVVYGTLCHFLDESLRFQSVLHCICIKIQQEEGQHLIVIYNLSIFESYLQAPYPNCCPGPEEFSAISCRLHLMGMYLSDINFGGTQLQLESRNEEC